MPSKRSRSPLLLFIASALLPFGQVLFLYNQNDWLADFVPFMCIAAGLFVLFALGFLLAKKLFGSPLSAFAVCVVAWLFLRYSGALFTRYSHIGGTRCYLLMALAAAILAVSLALLLRRFPRADRIAGVFLALLIGVFTFTNTFSAVRTYALQQQANQLAQTEAPLKTEFALSTATETPNIYWLHCDGMLGFDAFETYFGDAQDEFEAALAGRGFAVNRGAMLESGHKTDIALPALTSPGFYDAYLAGRLETHADAMRFAARFAVSRDVVRYANLKRELFQSFELRGYRTLAVAPKTAFFHDLPLAQETLLTTATSAELLATGGVLPVDGLSGVQRYIAPYAAATMSPTQEFLSLYLHPLSLLFDAVQARLPQDADAPINALSPLTESAETQDSAAANALLVLPNADKFFVRAELYAQSLIAKSDTPCITLLFYMRTHSPYSYDENGNRVDTEVHSAEGVRAYAGTHRFFIRELLAEIDRILAADPTAVIVIQGDHGLHSNTEQDFASAFGPDADASVLWNSVMSAVRVPEQYRTDDLHYALENPLNISRYLVNTFVGGGNYDYLPAG